MVCCGYRVSLALLSCAYSNTVSWGGAAAAGGDGDGKVVSGGFCSVCRLLREKLRLGPKEEEGGDKQ